jgi:hypothetical protein
MANALYPLWKQALMTETAQQKGLDATDTANGPYVALLVITSGGYVYSAAHQFYSDLNSIQGTPQQITSPTVANGIFAGQSVVFVNITAPAIGGFAIYRPNTGANGTWRLVLYEDTGIIGFPIAPNGGNLILTWNTQGIFQL